MAPGPSGTNNPIIPVDLENAIRNRRCILLAGCGLLTQIQIEDTNPPVTWRDGLERMVDWCVGKGLIREQENLEAIYTLIDRGQLSDASEKLEEDYLSNKLQRWECLNEVLLHESILKQPTISRLHDLVVQIPFRAYFTTNYDTLLERAFLDNHKRPLSSFYEGSIANAVKAYGEYFENKQPFILKLHGDIAKLDSILLGDRDFKRLKKDEHSNYRDGLKQLLLASSILCMGFEKTDHDLECFLTEAGIVSKTHIDRRNKYWMLEMQTEQSGGGYPIQDKRIEIISCLKDSVVVFFEQLLLRIQSRSGTGTGLEPNQGVSGNGGKHQDSPQSEQTMASQSKSPLNTGTQNGKLINVYVSYNDEADSELWKKLYKQLESMREWIAVKDRAKVEAGTDLKIEIRRLILDADIIFLMVSPDFTTSDMCQYEVEEAMQRRSELRIIPIILRPVEWKSEPYGKLQPLPKKGNGTPVSESADQERVFYDIATEIKEVVNELRQLQKSQ